MDKDEDYQENSITELKSRYQTSKQVQQPIFSHNYKLDPLEVEKKQEKRQLNIFQKQIISERVSSLNKKENTILSTLSPTQEKVILQKQKQDSQEMKSLSMQYRPDLQELLSPLNYYFQRKDLSNSTIQYMKTHSPDSPEKNSRAANRQRKRSEKNRQIYEQIYDILKTPQTQQSQKQRRMYFQNYNQDKQLESFLNNSPLNLSNILPIDIDQKCQVQSTKSQSQASVPLNQINQLQVIAKNNNVQTRAITSLNQQQSQNHKLRLFSRKSIESNTLSPKNIPKIATAQQINTQQQPDFLQSRKVLSVFKHRQIYSRSMNRRDDIFKNDDSSKINKTLDSESLDRPPFYFLEESISPKLKMNSETSNNHSSFTKYHQEQLPIRSEQSQSKQSEQKIQSLKLQLEPKKKSDLQHKLDISLIQFDQQFITLSNNHSVKNQQLQEKKKISNKQIEKMEQESKQIELKNQSQFLSLDLENAKNIFSKIKIRNEISSSLNQRDSNTSENKQENNKSNHIDSSTPVSPSIKINKEKIVRKYIKIMQNQNDQEYHQQTNLKNDEQYIQKVQDKYSYKKILNSQKIRQKSTENHQITKKPNRFFDFQYLDNPGPGQYNIPAGIGEKYSQQKKGQSSIKSQLNEDQQFILLPNKQNHQFLITNYFSPKSIHTIDNSQEIPQNPIHKKANTHNQIISYN